MYPSFPEYIPPFSTTICDPKKIDPSLPEYTLLFTNYMLSFQNLPLPSRIYPPFQQLYASLPEYTPRSQNIPPFSKKLYMRPSQHLPLPPRMYPPFPQLYATLPECTPPSQNIYPSFQQLYATLKKIDPSLPEYTLLFNNYVLSFQNLPLPPRIYPPFQQLYATLPESTPPFQNIPSFSTTIILCDPPRIYPSLPEYYNPLFNQFIDAILPESTRASQNLPPF